MRATTYSPDWPESWKTSFPYDVMEVFGGTSHRGYAYAYANRRAHTLDLIARVARPGARILDVAAAQGNYSLALAEAGYRVTWNDIRADLVEYVKLKYERGDLTFAPGNVFELGFEAEFDVVVMTEVIEHVAHPDQFLAKIAQFVVPGGSIVMTTPNGRYVRFNLPKFSDCADPSLYEAVQFGPNADGHIFLLHRDEIAGLARSAGLTVREIRLLNNVLTNGHVKTELALRFLPRALVRRIERLTSALPTPAGERLNASFAVLFSKA
jgi:2-polyprenyl-6-hydroxyphenyl methylase/3-demethylubiquinone-9 3-methyltransferase